MNLPAIFLALGGVVCLAPANAWMIDKGDQFDRQTIPDLEAAARQGDERALRALVLACSRAGDEKKVAQWLDWAIEREIPDALIHRALFLMEREKKASAQARVYAHRALIATQIRAEQGDAYHQMLLGMLYQYGLNGLLPIDKSLALDWMQKACFQHYRPAYLALHELVSFQNEKEDSAPLDAGQQERTRLFLQKHPEITGGDGRSEETAYMIQMRRPEVIELIDGLIGEVFPGTMRGGYMQAWRGEKKVWRKSLYTREGQKIDVYFVYPEEHTSK